MNKKELLEILRGMDNLDDPESNHLTADKSLLEYIKDKEIEEAFNDLVRWYS